MCAPACTAGTQIYCYTYTYNPNVPTVIAVALVVQQAEGWLHDCQGAGAYTALRHAVALALLQASATATVSLDASVAYCNTLRYTCYLCRRARCTAMLTVAALWQLLTLCTTTATSADNYVKLQRATEVFEY
jgi:hypothetical protein